MELPVSVINGRFKVLDRPYNDPGHCAVCGSVSKPVVDFDMSVDYYGAVLLCADCVREAFILMNTLHPELTAPAQVVPLYDGNALNAGMVHEYLAASLESTRRLIAVLPDSDLSLEDAVELLEADGDDAGETLGADEISGQLTFFQGPNDIPSPASLSGDSPFST